MIEFPVFDFIPDFSDTPTLRPFTMADVDQRAPAPAFIMWPWLRTETIQVMRFTDDRRTELARLMTFYELIGGRHGVFLMPSWVREFDAATEPVAGSTELVVEIEDYGAARLTTTRLDEVGRFIWCYDQFHGLHVSKVLESADDTTSTLTLESPWPWAPNAQAAYGFARLCRLDEDEIELQYVSDSRATTRLTFRSLRTYSLTENDGELTGEAVYELAPFETYTTRVEDLASWDVSVGYGWGPSSYGFVQAEQYATRWAAWFGSDRVRIGQYADGAIVPPADGDGYPTDLFPTLPANRQHIGIAFDQVGKEAICYQKDTATIEVRRWLNLALRQDSWEGTWPVIGFNGVLNIGAYNDNTTDVFVLYLKPGEAKIYCRVQRDNFGVEYVLNGAPTKPVALIRIEEELEGPTMVLVYVDDGSRVCRLAVTLPPQPPVTPSPFVAGVFGEFMGISLEAVLEHIPTIIPSEDGLDAFTAALEASGEVTDDISEAEGAPEGAGVATLASFAITADILTPAPGIEAARVGLVASFDYVFTIQTGNPASDEAAISVSASFALTV